MHMKKLSTKINIFKIRAKHDWWRDAITGKHLSANINQEHKEVAVTRSINGKTK